MAAHLHRLRSRLGQRAVELQNRRVIGIGLHVGGEDLVDAIVVHVAGDKAHGIAAHGGEQLAGLPGIRAPDPDPIRVLEVVAHDDVELAIGVEVSQQDGQRLRARGKAGRQQVFGATFVVVHARAVELARSHGRGQLGVV